MTFNLSASLSDSLSASLRLLLCDLFFLYLVLQSLTLKWNDLLLTINSCNFANLWDPFKINKQLNLISTIIPNFGIIMLIISREIILLIEYLCTFMYIYTQSIQESAGCNYFTWYNAKLLSGTWYNCYLISAPGTNGMYSYPGYSHFVQSGPRNCESKGKTFKIICDI